MNDPETLNTTNKETYNDNVFKVDNIDPEYPSDEVQNNANNVDVIHQHKISVDQIYQGKSQIT